MGDFSPGQIRVFNLLWALYLIYMVRPTLSFLAPSAVLRLHQSILGRSGAFRKPAKRWVWEKLKGGLCHTFPLYSPPPIFSLLSHHPFQALFLQLVFPSVFSLYLLLWVTFLSLNFLLRQNSIWSPCLKKERNYVDRHVATLDLQRAIY